MTNTPSSFFVGSREYDNIASPHAYADAAAASAAEAAAIVASTWRNARLSKTAAYTVANGDKCKTLALAGAALFTVTVNAATGYDSDFLLYIVNEDTRGKTLAISGYNNFILWPGQTVLLFRQNTSWRLSPALQRWRLAPGDLTIYTDYVNGNDSNDGLAPGAGNAFKSVMGAAQVALTCFDWSGSPQTRVTIQMAAGSTDNDQVHWSPHGLVGPQGGASLIIDGNGGTLSVNETCIQTYYGAVLQLRRITLVSTIGYALEPDWGSNVYALDGVIVGACGAGHFHLLRGAKLFCSNGYTIAGAAPYHVTNEGGYFDVPSGVTVAFTSDCAFTAFILASGGKTLFGPASITLNGHTITGQRWSIAGPSVLDCATANPDTYFPGNANGAASNGANASGRMSTDISQGGTSSKTAKDARINLGLESRATHGDSNYTLVAGDLPFIQLTAALTAARTWTLPLANAVNPGAILAISDGGGINGANTLTVQRQGTDGFNGIGVAGNAITIGTQYGSISVRSDGSTGWWLVAKT